MMPGVTHLPWASIVLMPAGMRHRGFGPDRRDLAALDQHRAVLDLPPGPSSTVALRISTSSDGSGL